MLRISIGPLYNRNPSMSGHDLWHSWRAVFHLELFEATAFRDHVD